MDGDRPRATAEAEVEDEEPEGHIQQGHADHTQAHNSTATEGDAQAIVQAFTGGVGCAGGGVGGGTHPNEACDTRGKAGREEGDHDETALGTNHGKDEEDDE